VQNLDKIIEKIETDDKIWRYQIFEVPVYFLLRWHILTKLKVDLCYAEQIDSAKHNTYNYDILPILLLKKFKYYCLQIRRISTIDSYFKKISKWKDRHIKPSDYLFLSTSNRNISKNDIFNSTELFDIVSYYKNNNNNINYVQYAGSTHSECQNIYDSFTFINAFKTNRLTTIESNILKALLTYLTTITSINFIPNYFSYLITLEGYKYSIKKLYIIIQKTRPKFLFTASIYTEAWILVACSRQGIRVVEVQHGILEKYYFSNFISAFQLKSVNYLVPHFILCFSSYWQKFLVNNNQMWHENNVYILGLTGLKESRIYKNQLQRKNQLIIKYFTQNAIVNLDDDFAQLVLKYGEMFKNYGINIVIRVHPDYQLSNVYKLKFSNYPYINIENSANLSSLKSLAGTDILFVANSSCINEAHGLGIPIISSPKYKIDHYCETIHYYNNIEELADLIISIIASKADDDNIYDDNLVAPLNDVVLNLIT